MSSKTVAWIFGWPWGICLVNPTLPQITAVTGGPQWTLQR